MRYRVCLPCILDELLADASRSIGPHHHAQPLALRASLARACKPASTCMCEKPLAMNARETAALVALARDNAAGRRRVPTTFAFIHYATKRPNEFGAASVGDVLHVTGSYVQDWLLKDDRFQLARRGRAKGASCGPSPTSARIGSTWCSSSPASGSTAVCADLHTVSSRSPATARRRGNIQRQRTAGCRNPADRDHHRRLRLPDAAVRKRVLAAACGFRRSRPDARIACGSKSPVRSRRWPGTASGPTNSGSATATGRTKLLLRDPAPLGAAARRASPTILAATTKAFPIRSSNYFARFMATSRPEISPPRRRFPPLPTGITKCCYARPCCRAIAQRRWVNVEETTP